MADAAIATPARRGESVEQVVAQIREGILKGRFALGQRLITRQLTTELGFSRSTVREALSHLASEGLVERVPNRGATVRRLSRAEIKDLFQIRELLEGLAARLAAIAVADRNNRAIVQWVWERVTVDTASYRDFHDQNLLIHGTIVRVGGNQQLEGLMARMHTPFVMTQARLAMTPGEIERSQREHREILQAVLAGDPDAAETAMRRHLRNTGEWLQSLPDTAFKQAPA
jgi:DNA-binding GntR family transcriptional regulator